MNYDDVTEVTSTEVRLNSESAQRLVQHAAQLSSQPVRQSIKGGRVGELTLPNLVIGEAAADWALGIATARRRGPNLALVTQWSGEEPEHFARRVITRLSKRRAFGTVVLVCNDDNGSQAVANRQTIVLACARLLPLDNPCPVTLICRPTQGGGIPLWAPRVVESVRRHSSRLPLSVALGPVAA